MSRSYEIRLTTPGFEKAVAQLNSIGAPLRRTESLFAKLVSSATGLDGVTRRVNKLADALERAAAASGAASATVQTAQGTGGTVKGSPGAAGKPRRITGPFSKMEEISRQREAAKAAGDNTWLEDLNVAEKLTTRRIALHRRRENDPEHLSRPGLLELFSDLNNLMRGFRNGNVGGTINTLASLSAAAQKNAGGGINMQQLLGAGGLIGKGSPVAAPAAGRTVEAITGRVTGSAALRLAGSLAGPAIVLTGALLGAAAAARNAREQFLTIGAGAAASGSNPGDIAALRALGLSPETAAGLGASLRAKLSSDPMAMAVGGYQLPGHLSGASNAPLVEKQMKDLAFLYREGNLIEMNRRARILGLEGELKTVMLSADMQKKVFRDMEFAKLIYTPKQAEGARDYEKSLQRIDEAWKEFQVVAFGGTFEKKLTDLNNWFADTIRWWATSPQQKASVANPQVAATKANTKAMEDLAAAIKGIVGGGPRAAGALSPAQRAAAARGDSLNAARDMRAFRL